MSLFVSSADAVSGNFSKLATKAALWTTTWPLWDFFDGNAHPNMDRLDSSFTEHYETTAALCLDFFTVR